MREHGYTRTPEEINTRIKNLKCFYNRVKKDIEMGVTTAPNWKHYDDMDEILSRPIFGNNARMPENPVQSESQSSQSPKDSVAHLVEPEMRIKEENITDDEGPGSSSRNADIEVPASSNGNDFLIPKDEPLDIDDGNLLDSEMDDDFDDDFAESDDISQPTLAKIPKLIETTSNNLPQLDKIQSRPVEIKLIENPTSQNRTVISTQPTATSAAAQNGKISLVPANILLKPQAQDAHQPIIYANPQVTSSTATLQSQTPTSATSQPMKVLLVNAMPKTVNANSQPSTTQTVTITATPMVQKNLPKVMPPLHPTIPQPTKISVIPQPNPIPPLKPTVPQKGAGFRALLSQLIQLQNENLLMQRQRLNVEKQRLEVEKQFGTRIVELLSNMQRQNQLNQAKVSTSSYRLRREQKANHRENDSSDEEAENN